MKSQYLIISFVVVIAMLAFIACGQTPTEQESDIEQILESNENYDSIGEDMPMGEEEYESPYIYNEKATVFDFEELLAADNYPHDEWTVNQLIDKFGEPEEINGWNFPSYESVRVDVVYADMQVEFFPAEAGKFSFTDETSEEDSRISLTESDMNLELYIMDIRLFDSGRNLPNGIEILKSTKAQIIAAYGEEPFAKTKTGVYDYMGLSYQYAFSDKPDYIGEITYLFDNNEDILSRVIISWGPGD